MRYQRDASNIKQNARERALESFFAVTAINLNYLI